MNDIVLKYTSPLTLPRGVSTVDICRFDPQFHAPGPDATKGIVLTKDGRPAMVDIVLAIVGLHLNVSPLIVLYPAEVKELMEKNTAFWVLMVDRRMSPTPKYLIVDCPVIGCRDCGLGGFTAALLIASTLVYRFPGRDPRLTSDAGSVLESIRLLVAGST